MPNLRKPKKLVVLCDGTWCGKETGTVSNIALLAQAMGIPIQAATADSKSVPFSHPSRKLKACYFAGCGLGGTFLEYLFNGATANDIAEDCQTVYQYIVDNYDSNTEIWMFGLSRGAYTVRCVAGMINNVGIVKAGLRPPTEMAMLLQEVYSIYRSPLPEDAPGEARAKAFRSAASWDTTSPIAFMGLIDTVGSLGIPRVNAGVGFDWPEFYDQNVSSEVQRIYHARSMHDRLWIFEPCRASRSDKFLQLCRNDPDYSIEEKWFPGCHYDLGRQKFKFFREGVNIVEKFFFSIPNKYTEPVLPNLVCADLVYEWLVECIAKNDPDDQIFARKKGPEARVVQTRLRESYRREDIGSGDVYASMGTYVPMGVFGGVFAQAASAATKFLDTLTPHANLGSAIQDFMGVKTVLNILLAKRDRRIDDAHADMQELDAPLALLGGRTVTSKAGLERYESKTVVKCLLVKDVLRRSPITSL